MAYGVILGQSFGRGLNAKLYVTYGSGAITNLTSVTATAQTSGKVYNGVYDSTNQRYVVDIDSYDIYSVIGTLSSGAVLPISVQVNIAKIYNITLMQFNTTLNDTDWNTISLISQNNLGDSVWAIGDAKEIVLNGNSKLKYRHSATGSTAYLCLRSVYADSSSQFCRVNTSGKESYFNAYYSYGFAPAFCV